MAANIDFGLYKKLFSPPVVRTMLAWDRLEQSGPPVDVRYLSSVSEAADWIVPWYVSAGREVSFDDPGAAPMRLGDVPRLLTSLSNERQSAILALATAVANEDPLQFLMATYRAAETEIILDGNHRAAAASIAGISCRILAFSVQGPLDDTYLPDLRHWAASAD